MQRALQSCLVGREGASLCSLCQVQAYRTVTAQFCTGRCRKQDGEATTAMRGAGYRGGEGPQNTAVQTLLLNMAWDDNHEDLHGGKLSPQMQKAVPWRQASRKWQRGSRAAFPLPSWIQQQSFPTGLLVLFFKVKKTVTYPTTQACKALAASNVCRIATVMDKAATCTTWRGYFLKEKRTSKDWVLYAL